MVAWHQSITLRTTADLLTGPSRSNFIEISIKIHYIVIMKMHLKYFLQVSMCYCISPWMQFCNDLTIHSKSISFNSLRPSDAYMHQWTWPSLIQIMACRLAGASHYLNQCWDIVDSTLRNKLVILIEIHTFSFKKMHLKLSCGKWRPFVSASMC